MGSPVQGAIRDCIYNTVSIAQTVGELKRGLPRKGFQVGDKEFGDYPKVIRDTELWGVGAEIPPGNVQKVSTPPTLKGNVMVKQMRTPSGMWEDIEGGVKYVWECYNQTDQEFNVIKRNAETGEVVGRWRPLTNGVAGIFVTEQYVGLYYTTSTYGVRILNKSDMSFVKNITGMYISTSALRFKVDPTKSYVFAVSTSSTTTAKRLKLDTIPNTTPEVLTIVVASGSYDVACDNQNNTVFVGGATLHRMATNQAHQTGNFTPTALTNSTAGTAIVTGTYRAITCQLSTGYFYYTCTVTSSGAKWWGRMKLTAAGAVQSNEYIETPANNNLIASAVAIENIGTQLAIYLSSANDKGIVIFDLDPVTVPEFAYNIPYAGTEGLHSLATTRLGMNFTSERLLVWSTGTGEIVKAFTLEPLTFTKQTFEICFVWNHVTLDHKNMLAYLTLQSGVVGKEFCRVFDLNTEEVVASFVAAQAFICYASNADYNTPWRVMDDKLVAWDGSATGGGVGILTMDRTTGELMKKIVPYPTSPDPDMWQYGSRWEEQVIVRDGKILFVFVDSYNENQDTPENPSWYSWQRFGAFFFDSDLNQIGEGYIDQKDGHYLPYQFQVAWIFDSKKLYFFDMWNLYYSNIYYIDFADMANPTVGYTYPSLPNTNYVSNFNTDPITGKIWFFQDSYSSYDKGDCTMIKEDQYGNLVFDRVSENYERIQNVYANEDAIWMTHTPYNYYSDTPFLSKWNWDKKLQFEWMAGTTVNNVLHAIETDPDEGEFWLRAATSIVTTKYKYRGQFFKLIGRPSTSPTP